MFGRDLRAVREEHGSLREMARTLGVSRSQLSRAENGKPIQPAHFLWLCDWAGLEVLGYLAPMYTSER